MNAYIGVIRVDSDFPRFRGFKWVCRCGAIGETTWREYDDAVDEALDRPDEHEPGCRYAR